VFFRAGAKSRSRRSGRSISETTWQNSLLCTTSRKIKKTQENTETSKDLRAKGYSSLRKENKYLKRHNLRQGSSYNNTLRRTLGLWWQGRQELRDFTREDAMHTGSRVHKIKPDRSTFCRSICGVEPVSSGVRQDSRKRVPGREEHHRSVWMPQRKGRDPSSQFMVPVTESSAIISHVRPFKISAIVPP
jgi:hypothetical protein